MGKTIPTPCTKEEMDALINAAIDNDFYFLLFNVAKKTGRRLGELYELKVKDIDFERKVMITKILKRRQRVDKEAILDDNLLFLFKSYIKKNNLKLEDYIFKKVSYRQIQNRVTYYSKKAGIPHKVSFHNFRHYFVTELFKKGWTYDKIAKLTGHSSISTLVNYDHTIASDLREQALKDIKEL